MHLLRDIVGFRPGRRSGLRVQSERVVGIKVVHAYGAYWVGFRRGCAADLAAGGGGGGYALSAGVGRRVARLVDEFVYGGAEEATVAEQVKPGGSCALQ